MIAPLVWGTVSGVGRQTQYASGINGHYAIWSGYYRVPGIPKGIESEDPAADANAHHRAAIMAAFNGEAKT
jgi:hypothetical protein